MCAVFLRLLRSNHWGNDSYTDNDVWGTLCARGDLDPRRPIAYGCMDVKVRRCQGAEMSKPMTVSSTDPPLPLHPAA